MTRRIFLAAIAAAWATPLAFAAPQSATPVLGFLSSGPANARQDQAAMFMRGLKEHGYIEGQNLKIEYRWASDDYSRLPPLAAELVNLKVRVIAATGGPVTALAAQQATRTIPIVFTGVADPVRYGLVASFNRPGGNVTGTAGLTTELDAKRLELLHELVPAATRIAVLVNPNRPNVDAQLSELIAAAQSTGRQLTALRAGTPSDIDAVFAALDRQPIDAMLVTADPFFNSHRVRLAELLAKHRVPAIYQWREFVADGGLISYGPSIMTAYYQAGLYAARILKGERPSDLPVLQPTTFELVINLKAAKALGIAVPPSILARADEAIE